MTTNVMIAQNAPKLIEQLYSDAMAMLGRNMATSREKSRLGRIARKEIAEIDMMFTKLGVNAWVDRRHVTASPTGNFIRYPILTAGKVSALAGVDRDLCVLFSQMRAKRITTAGVIFPEQWIELPYPLATRPLDWDRADLGALGKFEMLLGVNQSSNVSRPVVLDYADDTVSHVLLSGTTGSGKSMELTALVLSLAYSTSPADAKIAIVDPKYSRGIAALGGLPHVSLFQDLQSCIDAIASVKAEKDNRKRFARRQKLFLFVEEFADLDMEAGSAGQSRNLIDPLKSVVATGRELGVHVIACTQKATVDVIDTVLKSNLPTRIAGRVTTAKESEVATGLTDAGAERLPGRGAFIYANGSGSVQRVQGYYLSHDRVASTVNEICARWHNAKPYDIDWIESESSSAVDDTDTHVATVLAAFELGDLVADGEPVRGAKAKIVRAIFGQNANTGGANSLVASAVLDRLLNATTTTK